MVERSTLILAKLNNMLMYYIELLCKYVESEYGETLYYQTGFNVEKGWWIRFTKRLPEEAYVWLRDYLDKLVAVLGHLGFDARYVLSPELAYAKVEWRWKE